MKATDRERLAARAALHGPALPDVIRSAREAAQRALELASLLRVDDPPAVTEARLRDLALHHDGARVQLLRAAEVERLRREAGA